MSDVITGQNILKYFCGAGWFLMWDLTYFHNWNSKDSFFPLIPFCVDKNCENFLMAKKKNWAKINYNSCV